MNGRRVLAVLVAATMLLGACDGGGDDDEGATGTSTTTAAGDSATGGGSTTTAATDEAIPIVLGLGRLTVGGNALVFTAPRSQVQSYLERALGEPEDESDDTCGPGPVHIFRWPGLEAYVDETGFAGWYVDDDTFATSTGLRIGSSTADVKAKHPKVQISEGSLGTELFVPGEGDGGGGGLSGVLEDDKVDALWSGVTCIAR